MTLVCVAYSYLSSVLKTQPLERIKRFFEDYNSHIKNRVGGISQHTKEGREIRC